MRIKVADRIVCGLIGLLLLAFCAAMVAQVAFKVPVFAIVDGYFTGGGVWPTVIQILSAIVLFVLGVYCFLMLFRHRGKRGKFAVQKMEGGELIISVRALNTLVMKCIEQHPELKIASIYIENTRDGLFIRIRGTAAAGVSIPLTVDAVQQQVRQYLVSCTGLPIKDIQTEIQSAGAEVEGATFPIDKPQQSSVVFETAAASPVSSAAEPAEQPASDFVPQHDIEAVQRAVAEAQQTVNGQKDENIGVFSSDDAHTHVSEPSANDEIAGDGLPLHQRIFMQASEPCVIPEPDDAKAQEAAADKTSTEPAQVDPLQVAGVADKQTDASAGVEDKG